MKVNSNFFIIALLSGLILMGNSCKKSNEILPLDPVSLDAYIPLENIAVPEDSVYYLKENPMSAFSLPDGYSLQDIKKRKPKDDGLIGPIKSGLDLKK